MKCALLNQYRTCQTSSTNDFLRASIFSMPWKGLRSNTVGNRKPRRHSLTEKGESPTRQQGQGNERAESATQSSNAADAELAKPPTSRTTSGAASTETSLDTGLGHVNPPQQANSQDIAKVPRSNRFSLLKFRHTSDPQLSKTYAAGTATSKLVPPALKSTSKYSGRLLI